MRAAFLPGTFLASSFATRRRATFSGADRIVGLELRPPVPACPAPDGHHFPVMQRPYPGRFRQAHHHEEVIGVKLAKTCSGTSRPADGCYRLKPAARPEIPAKSGILGPVQNSHSRRLFRSCLLGKA